VRRPTGLRRAILHGLRSRHGRPRGLAMRAPRAERLAAATMMESCCQRCGAVRRRDQDYCLECGARLPTVLGTLPRVRRAWIRRLGWYPGDWAPVATGALAVGLAGAVAAIVLAGRGTSASGTTIVVSTIAGLAPQEPLTPAAARAGGAKRAETISTWPASQSGWTIILASYPVPGGDATAKAAAGHALKKGLTGVGLLSSSGYPGLQPGYLIVFDGIYPTQAEATAALGSVKSAGFAGAYTRRVVR